MSIPRGTTAFPRPATRQALTRASNEYDNQPSTCESTMARPGMQAQERATIVRLFSKAAKNQSASALSFHIGVHGRRLSGDSLEETRR